MTIGESTITNMLLRILGDDIKNDIEAYISHAYSRNFMIFKSVNDVNYIFGDSLDKFLNCLSMDELLDLRSYTGYNFKNINALLRNNWNYEINGILDQDKRDMIGKLSINIKNIISKFIVPDVDFVTFRGTTIDSFFSYGVSELSQFEHLKGKFLYEQGFTSSSIIENSSFFNKKLDDGRFCNVGIHYLIPSECDDGVLLLSDNISYSVSQNEFLLNSGSLFKVLDVSIDEINNNALLTIMLIPRKIYDLDYDNIRNNLR